MFFAGGFAPQYEPLDTRVDESIATLIELGLLGGVVLMMGLRSHESFSGRLPSSAPLT